MGGGGKGGSKRQVYDYFLSMDYGITHGPLDAINAINIKEKDAFVGPVQSTSKYAISKPDLFGGDEGEGGPIGWAEFYMGEYPQVMSSDLADRHTLTPATAPGYQGIAHIFFRGSASRAASDPVSNDGIFGTIFGGFAGSGLFSGLFGGADDRAGFQWSSNNPYLPPAAVNATRGPVGLSKALIYPIVGVNELTGEYEIAAPGDAFTEEDGIRVLDRTRLPDANPAAMIFECMTNEDWGKGEPLAAFNVASYEAAATTLENEHFGLTMLYMQQDSIENYVSEILDHIVAVQYQDPATGLWNLDLIRDDYDSTSLLVLDPSNCDVESIRTKGWGETTNDIKVSYTDPVSGDEETVSAQNLSNIAIQGGVVSDSRDYHGCRNPWLAKIIANRDVGSASRSLKSATVKVNRKAFALKPASVVEFTWPEEDILELPMRVTSIDYGNPKDRKITLELIEDVYGTPPIQIAAGTQLPIDYDIDPNPKDPDRLFIMTPPLPPLTRNGLSVTELDDNYPQSEVQFLISDSAVEFLDTHAVSTGTLANGSTGNVVVATVPPAYTRALGVDLVREVRSIIGGRTINNITGGNPTIGDLLVIGSDEETHEIIMLDSYDDGLEEWTVLRAMYDTIPLEWTATDRLWLLPLGQSTLDNRENIAGDEQTYRFLPRTRAGRLEYADATPVTYTPNERPHQPFRPASPRIDAQLYDGPTYFGGPPALVNLTWLNRNRLAEDSVAYAWDASSTTPEAGQTTTIRFRDADSGDIEFELTGLGGSGGAYDISAAQQYRFYSVEFVAVRDGIESYRSQDVTMEIIRVGYGNNYGFDYGENDG